MIRFARAVGVGAMAVVSLPGIAGAAEGWSAANTAPSRLDVQLSDLQRVYGGGYRFLIGRSIPNSQITATSIITGMSLARDALHGRKGGYIVEYVRKNGTTLNKGKLSVLPGLGSVAGAVNAYRNRVGPTLVVRDALHYRISNPAGLSYRITALNGVGDAAALHRYTSIQPHGIPTAYDAIVVFRRGNYTASLNFSSYKTLNLGQAIQVARMVDNRIKQAR
ncbi:MAG TPA: hypothetical protein VF898_05650 [Chloroflexota bacterium]